MTGLSFWKWLFLTISISVFSEQIDVVIPCHWRDYPCLRECVCRIWEHVANVRRVIVVTERIPSCNIRRMANELGFEIFFEEEFPFTRVEVGCELFPQLVRWYAFGVIPDLTRYVLMLNVETLFLERCQFVTECGKSLFNPGCGDGAWFFHAWRLVPNFSENRFGLAGFSNFMVFRRDVVERLVCEVETFHKKPFWRAYLCAVDPRWAWVSEWEIYFNYFLANHPRDYFLQETKTRIRYSSRVCLDR